jgi:hypothetical protein
MQSTDGVKLQGNARPEFDGFHLFSFAGKIEDVKVAW